MQKYRINTNIGRDQKVIVDIKQNFELLQILSLKLTQQDIYTSLCSDYGVVCGRISVNNGLGIPNARVSVFIPQTIEDEDDPVISALYPFKTVNDVNEAGFKYNLLPARKQHGGHAATGSFPDQLDILTREEVLEVYEKYYKYTVKTNTSGDFMIWGVPIGTQTLHVDIDLSDMGCFSLRPDDFIRKGFGVDSFKSSYEFKSSENIASLPQIVSFDNTIEIYPFWGSEDICQIGITRSDFDLSSRGIVVEPKALIIGGTFTDTGKNSINKHCLPKKDMGTKCSLSTENGKIEAIRFTPEYDELNRPILEELKINEDIGDDGSFAFPVPMNMDYLYTDEFGENHYTNDPNRGVPTSACYRFRFSLKDTGTERLRLRGTYLAPNIREYVGDEDKSYAWTTDYTGFPTNAVDNVILHAENGFYYPQDYFYRFQYNKVYTVSSFQNSFFKVGSAGSNRILGIKDIEPPEGEDCSEILTPPTNFGLKKGGGFGLLLSTVLAFLQYTTTSVLIVFFEFLATLLRTIAILFNFQIPLTNYRPLAKVYEYFLSASYQIQSAGQITLPLIIYDDCELCTSDDENLNKGYGLLDYCKIGELKFEVTKASSNSVYFKVTNLFDDVEGQSKYNLDTKERDACDAYYIPLYDMVDMNNKTAIDKTGEEYPRFYINIGGNPGSIIGEASFFISSFDGDSYYEIKEIMPNVFGFEFTNEEVLVLFGIDDAANHFEASPITGSTSSLYGYVIDRNFPKNSTEEYTIPEPAAGCDMYDTLYNENTAKEYLWFNGSEPYGDPNIPTGMTGSNGIDLPGIKELRKGVDPPSSGWTIGATVWYNNVNDRLPSYMKYSKIPDQTYSHKTKTGYSEFRDGVFVIVPSASGISAQNLAAIREWYRRTIIGLNFCGGVVSYSYIDNWLSGSLYFFQFKGKVKVKEKKKYSLDVQDYAFHVDTDEVEKLKVKACQTVVRYVYGQNRFYYRSCPYDANLDNWGYDIDTGKKGILHPTTFVDLGPRDEFVGQICLDPNLDANCSVSRSIGTSSFKSFGELLAFAINYKMDITNAEAKISSFFENSGFTEHFVTGSYLNGDITQLMSINNEAGIEGFDLQNPKYLPYQFTTLDPDSPETMDVFKNGQADYGPTPVTLKYADDGAKVRQCLNSEGYLTESAQIVPFFLWEKGNTGFGNSTNQVWDYSEVVVQPLQGMSSGYKFTNEDDKFLLPPISYDFNGVRILGAYIGLAEEFDAVVLNSDLKITVDELKALYDTQHHGFTLLVATGVGDTEADPTVGRLFIRLGNEGNWSDEIAWVSNTTDGSSDYSIYPTRDPYLYSKQILSTPFQFYFGLRAGKTGLDKFIAKFGPKDAFPYTEDVPPTCY